MNFSSLLFMPWSMETRPLNQKLSEAQTSELDKTVKCGYAKCVE